MFTRSRAKEVTGWAGVAIPDKPFDCLKETPDATLLTSVNLACSQAVRPSKVAPLLATGQPARMLSPPGHCPMNTHSMPVPSRPACMFSHAPSPLWPELSRQSQELAWCPSAWRCSWALTQLLKQVPYGPPAAPHPSSPPWLFPRLKPFPGCQQTGLLLLRLSWCGILIRRLAGGGWGFWALGGGGAGVGGQVAWEWRCPCLPLSPALASGAVLECLAMASGPQVSRQGHAVIWTLCFEPRIPPASERDVMKAERETAEMGGELGWEQGGWSTYVITSDKWPISRRRGSQTRLGWVPGCWPCWPQCSPFGFRPVGVLSPGTGVSGWMLQGLGTAPIYPGSEVF